VSHEVSSTLPTISGKSPPEFSSGRSSGQVDVQVVPRAEGEVEPGVEPVRLELARAARLVVGEVVRVRGVRVVRHREHVQHVLGARVEAGRAVGTGHVAEVGVGDGHADALAVLADHRREGVVEDVVGIVGEPAEQPAEVARSLGGRGNTVELRLSSPLVVGLLVVHEEEDLVLDDGAPDVRPELVPVEGGLLGPRGDALLLERVPRVQALVLEVVVDRPVEPVRARARGDGQGREVPAVRGGEVRDVDLDLVDRLEDGVACPPTQLSFALTR
jgi:ribosomal protein L13E